MFAADTDPVGIGVKRASTRPGRQISAGLVSCSRAESSCISSCPGSTLGSSTSRSSCQRRTTLSPDAHSEPTRPRRAESLQFTGATDAQMLRFVNRGICSDQLNNVAMTDREILLCDPPNQLQRLPDGGNEGELGRTRAA